MAATFSDGKAGDTKGYAAHDATGRLSPFVFTRCAVGETDVAFDIKFCGICHSDVHTVRSEWGPCTYPCVPGHELVGVVTKVGSKVSKFKAGDLVGVGCMVGSCKACNHCNRGLEQYCEKGCTFTYGAKLPDGKTTMGGYSSQMVCREDFVVRMPTDIPLANAAPLLCAGITTYSPMVKHGLNKPGMRIGVVGLGGLGSMALQFGRAFGCVVTAISTSPKKEAEARKLGATNFLVSTDAEAMKKAVGSLDGIIDTVAADHDINTFLSLIDVEGKYVLVGAPPTPLQLRSMSLINGGKTLTGSLIGGIEETQACLDFCAKHKIQSSIEMIKMDYINEAYDRLVKNDVNGRFVIDMATL